MTLEFLYNPTLLQNFTYLEPDSIISSLFVQSVIFGHSLCGLLNKLEDMGKCVGVVVRSYGCGEVRVRRWVWGGVCGEVGVGRWVLGGGCGEVGVGRWVWGGECGCGEVIGEVVWVWTGGCGEVGMGAGRWVWVWRGGCGYR